MKPTIHFLPDDIKTTIESGENLLAAAAMAGVYISARCGGEGVCGKCAVRVEKGEIPPKAAASLPAAKREQGYALACQLPVHSDLVVHIPQEVRGDGRIGNRKPKTTRTIAARAQNDLVGAWELNPPVKKRFLRLPPPSADDNISDMQRLLRAISKDCGGQCSEPSYDHPQLLKELPFLLREANWEVTVIILQGKREGDEDRIIAVEPGDTTAELYGLAIDIGTTTVNAVLIDLNTGKVIAEASSYNKQIEYGEDVISRIVYARKPDGLSRLQKKVVATINEIIDVLCRQVFISPSDISYIMAGGNTTMSHLLLGLDPRFIREAPYVPVCSQPPLTRAAGLGVTAHSSVRLFIYSSVASYVGGDIVSGVHACQMYKRPELTLFIDIGTNGEIVVGNQDWMVCSACSAGPAFEGGGIKFGMRASSGAIENFHIHPETLEPMIVTIERTKPRGICGSGLISIVAELLEAGVIDQSGKFNCGLDHQRIRQGLDGWEYVLAWADDALGGEDVVITEVDLDNLIRAKGAMYAGYQTLLESAGMTFDDLERVILAGNFGAFIDLERAISIGLLPDIDRARFYYLGNGSLLGCQMSLIDNRRFRERTSVRQLMTNIELSASSEFMNHYVAALFLPHTNMDLFPSVAGKLRR